MVKDDGALEPGGPIAAEIAWLWWVMLVIAVVVFLLFLVILARGLLRRVHSDEEPAATTRRFLVWGGVLLPMVVITLVFGVTLLVMRRIPSQAGTDALIVEVTGHQWWWDVAYPQYGIRTANEIHLPVDRQVELRLTSADVVHSFWIPALAGKLDLLPERVNTLIVEASETGVFRGVCAEFCGLQHAKMNLLAVVDSAEDHERWVERQLSPAAAPDDETAQRGLDIFLDAGCVDCHAIAGTEAAATEGPDLTHVASRLWLGAGALENTRENLSSWVEDPHDAKPGVDMPEPELSAEDLHALVAYLETLE